MDVFEAREATWGAVAAGMIDDKDARSRDARKGVKAAVGSRFLILSAIRDAAGKGEPQLLYRLSDEETAAASGEYLHYYYLTVKGYLEARGFEVTSHGPEVGLFVSWRT